MDFEKIIYIDADFISSVYEDEEKVSPSTTFSRQESKNAEIGAYFAKGGMEVQESKTFSLSSRAMLKALMEKLEKKYPEYKKGAFRNYEGTSTFWLTGHLSYQEWGDSEESFKYYGIKAFEENFATLAKEIYFSPGFSELFSASMALKGNIKIPVRCLARVMWYVEDAKNYTVCPYVIYENG
jgi:hypothetical protein